MARRRNVKIAVGTAGSALAVIAIAALPNASADQCTVDVTLESGQTLSFTVNVAPGTPVSSLLPPGTGPVKSASESCAPTVKPTVTTTATNTTSSTPTSSTPTTTTPKTSTGSTPPSTVGQPQAQRPSHHSSGSSKPSSSTGSSKPTTTATSTKPTPPQTTGGVPTPANPTYSLALPGPSPVGVPNFFIDSFQIPPFLLPIYQAAGTQYDVPWQVLAAINEIESDYGRNLSVSSAGAVGWMQFLPSTWKMYGVDATGSGYADPYNPVDAIFAAARYLHAAGASNSVPNAIYSYNHAWWYVQSVLLRAQLIGGMPQKLIGALTGLVQGHFPVAAPATYADDAVDKLANKKVTSGNAAIPVSSDPSAVGVSIYAKQNSPVIAVNDGKIIKVGENQQLGKYIELQDETGNVYTYANLGSIPALYPVPKPVNVTAAQITKELSLPSTPAPNQPATAGSQQSAPTVSAAAASQDESAPTQSLPVTDTSAGSSVQTQTTPAVVKERLFADPSRPASYAAGGKLQISNAGVQISNFDNYFSDVLHLAKNEYTLQPLKPGAIVVAGTILGRLGAPTATSASHLRFMIRPAGKNAPYIDPKPILDGWKLLEATAVYRADGIDPFFGPGAKNPSIGQILLMSKEQLQYRALADPHVNIYACGRRDIEAGLIDRRILAVIEFLSASGLDPTVSGLECGHSLTGSTGVDAAGATGSSVDISKINNIPVLGHQGTGSITDVTIRRLLTLQGAMRPDEIVSLLSYKGQTNTLSLPDHANRIQVTYTPLYGQNKRLSAEVTSILQPGQWIQLINRIAQIPEPIVSIAPSRYAIKVTGGG